MAPRAQIIVSTHFDDAVLSLAHVLQAAGPLATVVTVCGGPPPDGLPVSEWDAGCGFASGPEAARARVAEDAAACAVTGARPLPLDHADTPYALLPDAATLQAEIEPLLRGDCTSGSLPASATPTTRTYATRCFRSPPTGRSTSTCRTPAHSRSRIRTRCA